MDFQALYQSKLTTAAEAAKLVKSGDWDGLHLVHQPPPWSWTKALAAVRMSWRT